MTRNILLTGVGGQGTILASKLLTLGLQQAGYDVKMSEVHGMSQREGDVLTHVRYGEKVYSPVVEKQTAELMIGFEELEVLRNLEYLKNDKSGIVVLNAKRVNPITVQTGEEKYPENIRELIEKRAGKLVVVDATQLAAELGNEKVANIILLGTIIKSMQLENIDWDQLLRDNVKPQFVEINQKALALGQSLIA